MVGLIAGVIVPSLTDNKPALQEVIWYVDKRFRSHGRKLMDAFEQEAARRGLTRVLMALMENSMSERLDAFYRRCGYRRFEVQYIKEITPCQEN